ncbi:ribosomal L28 family-domain-containing protein [Aspergillus pseudodeflectus]|uniref:Ribosomal L28 family-domain-containing protein n=1 Tax=Aspergillus pseudodeflectus TaxID=176178 RepID=A0ABR4LB97_9EURO
MLRRPFSLFAAFHSLSLTASKRAFSTTQPAQKIKPLPDHIPPYPYKPNYTYRQSNTGLYGGATIQYGNKISQGRNEGKTRRFWKPNVRRKKLYSKALDEHLYVKVTRKAIRTIQKAGSLDQYVLGDSPGRVKALGLYGWKLRYRVMQTERIQKKLNTERERLGLPERPSFNEWLQTNQAAIWKSAEKQSNIRQKTKPTYNPKNY